MSSLVCRLNEFMMDDVLTALDFAGWFPLLLCWLGDGEDGDKFA